MAPSVTDKDRGLNDFLKKVFASKGLSLTVGIHEADGAAGHAGSKATVADIMTIHEYGLGHNPERSWLRGWADSHEEDNRQALRSIALTVVKPGGYSAEQGLSRAGALFVGQIQARMSSNIPPPLAAATVARKGSSVALINTGQGRSSIRFVVKKS